MELQKPQTLTNHSANQDIHLVVSSALQTYNEDKTGRADFAMEAVGATVLSIGCTGMINNHL